MRVEPEADGRGLSLSVAPGWCEAGSGVSRLWGEGMRGAVLEAEMGYEAEAFGGFGEESSMNRAAARCARPSR